MQILTIESKPEHEVSAASQKALSNPRSRYNKPPKGREFSANLMCYVIANEMWEAGKTSDNLRPVFLYLAGSQTSLRPFTANLQEGRRAVLGDSEKHNRYSSDTPTRFEVLRSGGYAYKWQNFTDASRSALLTIYQPSLFDMDPGMIPDTLRFISMPPTEWVQETRAWIDAHPDERQAILDHARRMGILRDAAGPRQASAVGWHCLPSVCFDANTVLNLAAIASHFSAYLAFRTPLPLPIGLSFAMQLLLGLLSPLVEIASFPVRKEHYISRLQPNPSDPWWWARSQKFAPLLAPLNSSIGLEVPIACSASHEHFERVLAAETQSYFAVDALRHKS